MGFHDLPGGDPGVGDGMAVDAKATPDLHLSMLEFYLFSFAWVRGTPVDVIETRSLHRKRGRYTGFRLYCVGMTRT